MMTFIHSLVLVLSLSTDVFAASLAYGLSGIRVPRLSAGVLSLVCSLVLYASLLLGELLSPLLPEGFSRWLGFSLLLALALLRLAEQFLQKYYRKHSSGQEDKKRGGVLDIYADVAQADADSSHCLSEREAFALALALSLDGAAAGMGAALGGLIPWVCGLLSLGLTWLAVAWGCWLGSRIGDSRSGFLPWLSCLLLLILAFGRLLSR